MSTQKYDKTSVNSIVSFARLLTGKTLNETVTLPVSVSNPKNKGDLGGMVEAHFFELPPTNRGIDFPEAGLELKVTGLVRRSDGEYRAKERLVLTMINYMEIVHEDWEFSTFLNKCKLMLILFYLYEKNVATYNQRFVLDPLLFDIKERDEEIIRKDWEFIRERVRQGRAHEISEGDTFYLGACRKGSGASDEKLLNQPFSEEKVKSRAFSFKPSYVNTLIRGKDDKGSLVFEPTLTLDEAIQIRFAHYLGLSLEDIASEFGYKKVSPKSFTRQLAVQILSNGNQSVPELEKAGIEMKTIRLAKSGKPREHMSFPGFKYLEIVNQVWEESSFFNKLENKFLFIVFKEDISGVERLHKVMFWNMPYEDRLEAQKVWEETKRRVGIDASNLPKSSESKVAHVRPKARNSNDTIPTPQGTELIKKCFWLNADYISQAVSSG